MMTGEFFIDDKPVGYVLAGDRSCLTGKKMLQKYSNFTG